MMINSIKIGGDEYNFYALMQGRAIGVNVYESKIMPAFPRFQFTTLSKDPRPRCYYPPNFGFSLKALRMIKFNQGKLRVRRPIII